jgi:hypothetical protein
MRLFGIGARRARSCARTLAATIRAAPLALAAPHDGRKRNRSHLRVEQLLFAWRGANQAVADQIPGGCERVQQRRTDGLRDASTAAGRHRPSFRYNFAVLVLATSTKPQR